MLQDDINFVLKHYPVSQTWETGAVSDWLQWAAAHKCLFIARDENHCPIGLTIARTLSHIDDNTMSDDAYDADGDIIFIDLAIAPTKAIGQVLSYAVITTFGTRKTLAFRHNGKIKRHSYAKARKALFN